MRIRTPLTVCLAAAATLVAGAVLSSEAVKAKYTATELKEPPPEPLAVEIRAALGKTGFRVSDSAGKPVCDVWLRAELPVLEKFQEQLELKYPIEPGTLVGAIRFPASASDYRKQAIKAGVYTLRYGQQPQDGNHIGTAQYRDFVILGPVAEDKSPDNVSQDQAMERSKKVAGTPHPAIMSLLPPQKGHGKLPTIAHDEALDLHVLVAQTAGKQGSKSREFQIELVAVGHAPE